MATSRSAQSCVLDLLRYVGVTGFAAVDNDQALNRPGIDSDDVDRAIGAINTALQTIQRFGPQSMKDGERSAYFRAPVTGLLTSVAEGSTAAVASSTPSPLALGCSVLIDGDADVNRIIDLPGGLNVTLLRAYRGTATSATVLVYGDCALLPADVAAVEEPVSGSPNLKLREAQSLDEFNRYSLRCDHNHNGSVQDSSTAPILGTPSLYYVERQRDGQLFMRITPRPGASFNATFKAKLRAERIDDSVLDQTGVADPDYKFTSIHDDEIESILLPIARWEFFSHPALKNAETRNTVEKRYNQVMTTLRAGTTLEPSVGRAHARYT